MDPFAQANRHGWDERAPAHAASPDYALDRFTEDPDFLSAVVRFDRPRLGDISGVRGVHLQCHIGTDTISLARLGARMTGLDFSPASLAQARSLAAATGSEVDFVESDVHDARDALGDEMFDLVYTGIGALCWLPSVDRWARVVASLLTPGGRLFIREGHPVLWSLADGRTDGVLAIEHPYFEHAEPFADDSAGTYVETEVPFVHTRYYSWNHGLGEIITALFDAGLQITAFAEHDSAPWAGLPGQMVRDEREEWRLIDRPARLPSTYTLQAVKR
jgi:SAM-dependent methyltransferase